MAAVLVHSLADLTHVPEPRLTDVSMLTGLLIAAASAAGLATTGAPIVRALPSDGVIGLFVLDPSHIAVHTYPSRGVALVDVLAPAADDGRRAIEVFVRRLAAGAVEIRQHERA